MLYHLNQISILVTLIMQCLCTDGEMILLRLKQKVLFESLSNHSGEHDD